jgi:Tol biopolymer transport system component
MIRKVVMTAGLIFLLCSTAAAQFYPTRHRSPDQNWQQLSTDHFKILFPQGEDSAAWKTARILEKEYPKVQKLTGGSLTNFPVILNNDNDRSNGFVTTLHFRSEIDITPIRGKALNPETGGWLENVAPHELVHALQFSNLGGFGLGQIVNILSPDLARSMHGAPPSGIAEGLATYYESESVTPGGGRGNYPFFYNQFNAVFDSPARWSMGQMVHVSAKSRPFNRHYIGGYEFTQWLQQVHGPETSRDAIEFHVQWPILGYGVALKHATGQWPAQLYDRFEADKKKTLTDQKKAAYTPLPIDFEGADIRRPKWLSNSSLIFYGSYYNSEAGFFEYDLESKSNKRLLTTGSVSDFNYALSADRDTLLFSYNKPNAIYSNAFKATLVEASLSDGSNRIINNTNRLFAPSFSSDQSLLALETDHTHGKLTEIDLTNRSVKTLYSKKGQQIITAAGHPENPDSIAVVINRGGTQALWLTSKQRLKADLSAEPAIAFPDGSVFDPVWHPDGSRLLFSADFSGALQVYEYDIRSSTITQLTNASYNAFEGSYNQNGDRIAFVMQRGNERLPVVLGRDEFYGKKITTQALVGASARADARLKKDEGWKKQPYSTGFSWLKPRTILPAFKEISGSDHYRLGAGLHSSDLLQEQSYSLEATLAEERLWYDLSYQNKQFFPGFRARAFSEPAFRRFRFVSEEQDTLAQTFLRQERSVALSMPMRFTLAQNIDFTGLYVEPELRQSQIRYFNQDAENPSEFSSSTIGNIFTQLSYRVDQNIRDVQPHSGLVFYSELEHFFRSASLSLRTESGSRDLEFARPTALRGGMFGYVSPLRRWKQSLRIGLEAVTQTNPVFDNQSIVSDGFSESVFPFSNNLVSLSGRYTIPLVYPDEGGLLLPLYLSGIYLSGFANTVADPASPDGLSNARTVIGGGLRLRFRLSNLSLDIGIGVSWEPSRNNTHYFIGDF